ncbi:MAG: helix-turn-helix domain-containing protein [Rhizobiaceae bacterium]
MAKKYNAQSVRIHQSYEVSEVVDLLRVSPQTVRSWIKMGLPVLNAQRPILILGFQLRDFLRNRNTKAKQPTKLGEFYCLHCRKPRMPYGKMADYIPFNDARGRLVALCEVCEGTCNRMTSKASLPELSRILEIAINTPGQPKGTFQIQPEP